MDDADPAALEDVAYGIFEIFLNMKMRATGTYLFELVEQGTEFRERFETIFREFETDYAQLAEALLRRFGSSDTIYAMIRDGEGVYPSKTTQMYWIVQDAPAATAEETADSEIGGKWLIFVARDTVDEAWRQIRNATCTGELGVSAKVSTAKPNPDSRDERYVIYTYTKDWREEEDVMRVRERLRDLGFSERIGYKRNIETYRGEYSEKGKRVTYYSA